MADGENKTDRMQRRLYRFQRRLQRQEASLRDFLDEMQAEMEDSGEFSDEHLSACAGSRESVRDMMNAHHVNLVAAVEASRFSYAQPVAQATDDPGDTAGGGSDTSQN